MTSFYEEMAADVLADRDPIDCRECGGEGGWPAGGDFDEPAYEVCPYCDGTGMWNGRAI